MALNQENEEMHTVKLCGDGENQGQDHSLKNGKHHGTDQRADPGQGRDRESERNNAPSAKEDQRTVSALDIIRGRALVQSEDDER